MILPFQFSGSSFRGQRKLGQGRRWLWKAKILIENDRAPLKKKITYPNRRKIPKSWWLSQRRALCGESLVRLHHWPFRRDKFASWGDDKAGAQALAAQGQFYLFSFGAVITFVLVFVTMVVGPELLRLCILAIVQVKGWLSASSSAGQGEKTWSINKVQYSAWKYCFSPQLSSKKTTAGFKGLVPANYLQILGRREAAPQRYFQNHSQFDHHYYQHQRFLLYISWS